MQIKITMFTWLLSKRQEITSVDEDMDKREYLCTVCGNISWCHYGKQYGSSSKVENRTTMWSSNSTSGYLSEENKDTISKTHLHHHIHCGSIYRSQYMVTTHVSIEGWMNKENVVRVCIIWILFSHKKEEILPFVTTWMDLEGIILHEISQTERKVPMVSLICGLSKEKSNQTQKTKLIDIKNRLVVARGGGWRMDKVGERSKRYKLLIIG